MPPFCPPSLCGLIIVLMQINVAKLSLYNNFIINFRSFAFRILTVSPVKPFPFSEIMPKIKKQSKKRLCRNLHKQTMAKPFQSICQQVFYLLQVLIHITQRIRVILLVKIRPLIYLKTYMLVDPAACGFCSFTVTVSTE